MKDYDGEVRIALMHNALPMHPRAMPAALAAEAAGKQGKFWEMHEKLFTDTRALNDEDFEKYANELGLDVAKFKKDMEDPALKKKIEEQMRLSNTLGARGTPAFFINGRFLSGAQPVEAFKKVIDEEMKKADKLIASGTPKAQVYEKTIASGLAKP
jgi:protein-disulfide isomerase